jgi:SNF2 family DNA or RNA helicase
MLHEFFHRPDLKKKISAALTEFDISHRMLRGTTFEKRNTLKAFSDEPNIQVLLLDTQEATSGANLTHANHVFLVI